MTRPRIAFVVTHPVTARILLRGQLRFLREHGFDVTVISSPGDDLDRVREREDVQTIAVPMSRSVRLTEGPRAFGAMLAALRRARPDVINASTPKAGLLGMIAARLLRVRARVYLVRGTLLETHRGTAKAALLAAERVATSCAHEVVLVSESLRSLYRSHRLVRESSSSVIPSNGIDLTRFRPRSDRMEEARALRGRLGIAQDAKVVGFVGRLVADKGVADMIVALERAAAANAAATFLVVGGDLAGDALPPELDARLRALPRVVFAGKVDEPAPYYSIMDVLLFPSHREGLPNVPLEAAASEVPTVGYRVTGVRDAVADGETGHLVTLRDANALGDALVRYLADEGHRAAHGRAARARVVAKFEQRRTWEAWLSLYERLLARRR